MEPKNKGAYKDIVFAFQLGSQVIGTLLFAVYIGIKIDTYFASKPIAIIVLLGLAFGYILKLLLGVGQDDRKKNSK